MPSPALYPLFAEFLGVAEQDLRTLCSTPFVVESSGSPTWACVGSRRQELRLTRSALAEAIGVTQGTIVAWALGHRVPGSTQLPELAGAIGGGPVPRGGSSPPRCWSSVGELILARQRQLGLRAADVAGLDRHDEATVSRWVNGRSQPALRNLRRLVDVLKVPYDSVVAAAAGWRHEHHSQGTRRARNDDGAALIEFAIILPVMLIIFFGLTQLGFAMKSSSTVTGATRSGAPASSARPIRRRRGAEIPPRSPTPSIPSVVRSNETSSGFRLRPHR